MYTKRTHQSTTQSGFTLIEIIVSLGIFTVVAVVAVGAFLKVIDANKKSQTLKTAINNVNFALESMTREMRVGSVFTCSSNQNIPAGSLTGYGQSCLSGGSGTVVAFLSSKIGDTGCNLIHAYFFDIATNHTISKAEQAKCADAISASSFIPVISPDAVIDEADIKVVTASGASGPQPRAQVRLKGHAGTSVKNLTYFDVQTTVSQRNPF